MTATPESVVAALADKTHIGPYIENKYARVHISPIAEAPESDNTKLRAEDFVHDYDEDTDRDARNEVGK
jgi:hypothetical protein